MQAVMELMKREGRATRNMGTPWSDVDEPWRICRRPTRNGAMRRWSRQTDSAERATAAGRVCW